MKKILTIIFILSFAIAQMVDGQIPELWGMTIGHNGGSLGTIFKVKGDGSGFQTVYVLDSSDGGNPFSNLFQASDGKLYGTTAVNSPNGFGVLFSFDILTNNFSHVYDFNFNDGYSPGGRLMEAGNGKLYGMTEHGGINANGTIYNFDIASNSYSKIFDFDFANGANPYREGLTVCTNGKLYGTTNWGGAGNGVIYNLDTLGNVYTKLFDFNGTTGAGPVGSMIQAGNGVFYGMTEGGDNIFSFDPDSNICTNLFNFNGSNGYSPTGGLLEASNGLLYGMTPLGGANDSGVIFSFDPANNIFTDLFDFSSINGTYPVGGLMQGSDGKLYGATLEGGVNYLGVIFSFDPIVNTYTKIFDFNSTSGSQSESDLIEIDSTLLSVLHANNSENLFRISPNPTTGLLTLRPGETKIESVAVYNMLGEEVMNVANIAHGFNRGALSIDISQLPAGIYIVQANSKEKVVRGKVVKE